MDRYANTSAATIPLLLDERVGDGTIAHGHRIVFTAMGAGWTSGTAILRWQGRDGGV
jgi:3-oxoacyl-[acyl-carrier-protein] synthase-3